MALYFANGTGQRLWVAFAYYDPGCGEVNQNFRKQGWWQIDILQPGTGFLAWDVDLRTVNRFAYFYVEAADGSSWHGAGNAWLSVTDAIFNQCALDGAGNNYRWVDFIDLDFTWADPGWDTVVIIWHWDGKNRITFAQHKERGPDGEDATVEPIAPDVVS